MDAGEKNEAMARIGNLIWKLQDPSLVAKFQNWFGVYHLDPGKNNQAKSNGTTAVPDVVNNIRSNGVSFEKTILKHRRICSCGENTSKCTCQGRDSNALWTPSNNVNVVAQQNNSSSENEEMCGSDDPDSCLSDNGGAESSKRYKICNPFWYYVFTFGASLGYEMFYSSFFPFWFWNIDSAVCRRVILVWVITMYIGQALKEIFKLPRPADPPVVRLEPSYSQEYGMPSTHAMVAVAVPFSFLIFTMHSRLYLGMHSILDIVCGLLLATLLMIIVVPFVDDIDAFQLTNPYAPLVVVGVLVTMAAIYPCADFWTPTRGDTTVILGTCAGVSVGSWLNFQMGLIRGPGLPPPYEIIWPDYGVIGLALLRACIGILCIVACRAFFKSVTFTIMCHLLGYSTSDAKSKEKTAVEVTYKFITYVAIGLSITYLSPMVFRLLHIERITLYTEV